MKIKLIPLLLIFLAVSVDASVDSDFKANPDERFVIYTGDGNYKQAYHWEFNSQGTGTPITIFLNHGSGGEWYDEIENKFGPCGPDYISESGDFSGTDFEGLCTVGANGERLYLADFNDNFVPVGPELEEFMLKKIVGSTKFAAWYWQDAFRQFDSPVHVFMVGRYNVVKDPNHLNNTLYWLNVTDENTVTRDTQPPYNFDGYGVSDIDGDNRPIHAAPDISAFDNMFLYKAIKEQFPGVDLTNTIIEGRSNGGSAMFALAADYRIWPIHMKQFWERNLQTEPDHTPTPEPVETLSLDTVIADPVLAEAFNNMLSQITAEDVLHQLSLGNHLQLYSSDGQQIVQSSEDEELPTQSPGDTTPFVPSEFPNRLTALLGGNFYENVKLVHGFYPGCRLDGFMSKDESFQQGEVNDNGDNNIGYQVALKAMFSYAESDSLYTYWCDDRVLQAANSLTTSSLEDNISPVEGNVYSPAGHGFDYKEVYKNLSGFSDYSQAKSEQARLAIEHVVNQAIKEIGLEGQYSLPTNLD